VFSRTERTFLEHLARGPEESENRPLAAAFPNPVYRRKLLWGIRQKAGNSLEDWHLYVEAAQNEPRLLPRRGDGGADPVPVFADPLVTFVEEIRSKFSRNDHRRSPMPGSTYPKGR